VIETTNVIIEPPSAEPVSEREINPLIRPRRSSKTPPAHVRVPVEITESPVDAPGSGRRKGVLDDITTEESLLRSTQQDDSSAVLEQVEALSSSPTRKRKRPEPKPKPAAPKVSRSRHNKPSQIQTPLDEIDELSPEQPKPGRYRKPRMPVRDRFSDIEEAEEVEESTEQAEEQDEAEAINDEDSAALLMKRRGRRVSRNMPAAQSPDLDEAEGPELAAVKKQKGRSRKTSSPVQQRHPKANAKASQKTAKVSKSHSENLIPITVHRLTRGPLYDEDESDADILNSEIPHTRRGGVNAVDVLSQICQEIISAGLDTIEGGENNTDDRALKREYKTKWKAVESFGKELQTRLLEHVSSVSIPDNFCAKPSPDHQP